MAKFRWDSRRSLKVCVAGANVIVSGNYFLFFTAFSVFFRFLRFAGAV